MVRWGHSPPRPPEAQRTPGEGTTARAAKTPGRRIAAATDKTLSCSCPAQSRKNFVSISRTTSLRSVVPPAQNPKELGCDNKSTFRTWPWCTRMCLRGTSSIRPTYPVWNNPMPVPVLSNSRTLFWLFQTVRYPYLINGYGDPRWQWAASGSERRGGNSGNGSSPGSPAFLVLGEGCKEPVALAAGFGAFLDPRYRRSETGAADLLAP